MAGFDNQQEAQQPSNQTPDVQTHPDASASDAPTPLGAQLLAMQDAMKVLQSYEKATGQTTSPITLDNMEPTFLDMGNLVFSPGGSGSERDGGGGLESFDWKAMGNDGIEMTSWKDGHTVYTIYDTKGNAFTKTDSGYEWQDVHGNKTALTAQGEGVKMGADGSIQTYTVPIPGVSPPTRTSKPSS